MLTADRLKQILHYEPSTGAFTWLSRRSYSKNAERGSRAGSLAHGYVIISIDNKKYKAHRLAWLYMTGEFPSSILDHIDRNRSNNAWQNLREATRGGNAVNTDKRRNNPLGLVGVTKHGDRFRARISAGRKHLGVFDTAEQASGAYAAHAKTKFGEFFTE